MTRRPHVEILFIIDEYETDPDHVSRVGDVLADGKALAGAQHAESVRDMRCEKVTPEWPYQRRGIAVNYYGKTRFDFALLIK